MKTLDERSKKKKLLIVCFIFEIARRGKSTKIVGRFMLPGKEEKREIECDYLMDMRCFGMITF